MEDIMINDDFGIIENHNEVLENEKCRITIVHSDSYIRLDKYEQVDAEEPYTVVETRYHDYLNTVSLEDFDELWANSWLWEECEQRGDYEVVINRKHNEIVIGKIVDEIAYTDENGTEFFNPVWKHKYLPMYPLILDEIFAEADRMFEVEPLIVMTGEPLYSLRNDDYNIAGRVMIDSIQLTGSLHRLEYGVRGVGSSNPNSLEYKEEEVVL